MTADLPDVSILEINVAPSDLCGFSIKLRFGDAKMKKSLVVLALAGAVASAAHAQSAPEIYGIVDMGFVAERGGPAGSISKLTSGTQSGTRLGLKGTEDLGNNVKALFVLETGIAADAGGFNQGGLAFGRQSFLGVQSDLGTVTFGRQYAPIFNTMMIADPFAAGMAGAAQNLMPTGGIRINNAIKYTSPIVFGGFSTEIAYGFGETPDSTSKGQEVSAAVNYSVDNLKVALAYNDWSVRTVTPAPPPSTATVTTFPKRKDWFLAANYDLQIAKIFAGVTDFDIAGIKGNDYLIGAQIPVDKHSFIVSYITKDVRNTANRDANQIALGYTYSLSKRTNLYAAWGRIDNDSASTLTVGNNSETGSGDKAFNLGLRHMF